MEPKPSRTPTDAAARIGLGLASIGLLVWAIFHRAHGSAVADSRTYIEMTAGIVKNGLPYLDNGPLGLYAGLEAPWNVVHAGHLWGVYGPVYPYVVAPFMRMGGLALVSQITFAQLVPLMLVTFALGRRFLGDERYAAIAAVLTIASTPILAKAVEPSAYLLCTSFAALATWMVLEAASTLARRRLVFAFIGGVAGGLALGSHLLCVPLAGALLVTVGVIHLETPDFLKPHRVKTTNAIAYAIGLGMCVVPLACFNKARFGSWNPFSYGPVPWHGGAEAAASMTMGRQLVFGIPCFAFIAAIVAAILLVRRRPAISKWAFVLLGTLFVLDDELRAHLITMAKLAWSFVVELGLSNVENYAPFPGTFGPFRGGRVVKSLLQATPLLVFAFVPRFRDEPVRRRVALVLAPCVGLGLYLLLRANQGLDGALGQPWLSLRYTFPALPMLMCVAMIAVRDAKLRVVHWVAAAAVGALIVATLMIRDTDETNTTQIVVLVVPLVAIITALAAEWLVRKRAWAPTMLRGAIAACVGIGLGESIGHDYRLAKWVQIGCDGRVDAFAEFAPKRFAVIGKVGDIDDVLALRVSRDVEYADLSEWQEWTDVRPLLDHWFDEGRDVFLAATWPRQTTQWADITFEPVGPNVHGFFRVRRLSEPSSLK